MKIWGTSTEVEQGNVDNYISFFTETVKGIKEYLRNKNGIWGRIFSNPETEIKFSCHMSRDRLRATNAETIVKKIKRLFYNDYYVDHYINYDYSL